MQTTSIEVKCECAIPFHAELVTCLQKLLSGNLTDDEIPNEVPHWQAIRQALHEKMLFIKIGYPRRIKSWRPRLVAAMRRILNKNIVGTIRAGDSAVTLILL